MAERWNGRAWRVQAVPLPGDDSALNDVACPAVNRCVAVGFWLTGSANKPFSEVWNGRRWKVQAVAEPRGTTYGLLNRIACPSRNACVAVGQFQVHGSSKSRTLIEKWGGKGWRRMPSPNPVSGVNGSELHDVSCLSARYCLAVGRATNPGNRDARPLAEVLRGSRWHLAAESGSTSALGSFAGVSCASKRACMAVGTEYTEQGVGVPLAEQWSGGRWIVANPLSPAGSSGTSLEGVGCPSPATCLAVGYYFGEPQGFSEMPLGELWNGSTWAATPFP